MRKTEMFQEIRKMGFEEVFSRWQKDRLTQEEAAEVLGVSDRTFRRYIRCTRSWGWRVIYRRRGRSVGGQVVQRLTQARETHNFRWVSRDAVKKHRLCT